MSCRPEVSRYTCAVYAPFLRRYGLVVIASGGVWEINVAVRIRLKRMGRRHHPVYRIAAVDGRKARDSNVLEELGCYDPVNAHEEQQTKLDRERIEYWLSVGAQPSDTVRRLLEKNGILSEAKPRS